MPDENGVFAGAELRGEGQPESRASLDVVGEGLVDDGQAEGRTFGFDPWIPEVAGRTAAVTVDDDDLYVERCPNRLHPVDTRSGSGGCDRPHRVNDGAAEVGI